MPRYASIKMVFSIKMCEIEALIITSAGCMSGKNQNYILGDLISSKISEWGLDADSSDKDNMQHIFNKISRDEIEMGIMDIYGLRGWRAYHRSEKGVQGYIIVKYYLMGD